MAARKKYPSDYRRWFKVKDDILDNRKLDACDANTFRFFINLLAMLHRTHSHDGVIRLGRRALNVCACREQHRHALRTARAGAAQGLFRISEEGPDTVITVPNWAKHQEIAPADSAPAPGRESREEREKKENTTGRKRPASPPSQWCHDGSLRFYSRLSEHLGTPVPHRNRVTAGAKILHGMARGGVEQRQIEYAIEWLFHPDGNQASGEFALQVEGLRALREKWEKVVAAIQRQKRQANGSPEKRAADRKRESAKQREQAEAQQRRNEQLAFARTRRDSGESLSSVLAEALRRAGEPIDPQPEV